MNAPMSRQLSCALSRTLSYSKDAMNEPLRLAWRGFTDLIARGDQSPRFVQLGVGIVMDCSQTFAFFHALADALVELQSHSVIDPVLFLLPPAAQHRQRNPELLAVRARNKSRGAARNLRARFRRRQPLRLVYHSRVPALQRDPLPEFRLRLS